MGWISGTNLSKELSCNRSHRRAAMHNMIPSTDLPPVYSLRVSYWTLGWRYVHTCSFLTVCRCGRRGLTGASAAARLDRSSLNSGSGASCKHRHDILNRPAATTFMTCCQTCINYQGHKLGETGFLAATCFHLESRYELDLLCNAQRLTVRHTESD